jgi:hypothetical protein
MLMDTTPETKPNILETAWKLHTQFGEASGKRKKIQNWLRLTMASIGILATFFAILSSIYPEPEPAWRMWTIKITLILLPILASILASFSNRFFPGGDWLILRAGAELVLREIYQYRTIYQGKEAKRRVWLEGRLREIHLQVFNGLNGVMVLEPYTGKVPSGSRADSGFEDLTFEEYYKYRVKDQLDWHTKKVQGFQKERIILQILILFVGGLGAFLGAIGGSFGLWVALVTAFSTALVGWQEIRNLDMTVRNYSKVILDLTAISTHWSNLDSDRDRSKKAFDKVVLATETLLWSQSMEYIKSMQEVVAPVKKDDKSDSDNGNDGQDGDEDSQSSWGKDSSVNTALASDLITSLITPDAPKKDQSDS